MLHDGPVGGQVGGRVEAALYDSAKRVALLKIRSGAAMIEAILSPVGDGGTLKIRGT